VPVPVQRLSHIGICVSDLERSTAFYRDALGFEERSGLEVSGADAERLVGLDDLKLRAVYLERDGTRIELLHYESPGVVAGEKPNPLNRLGLTHLSLRVTSLAPVEQAIVQLGGAILAESRIENARFRTKAVFATDPDGLRIELLETPGDPDALPG
jgi:glyoxylase I family protein